MAFQNREIVNAPFKRVKGYLQRNMNTFAKLLCHEVRHTIYAWINCLQRNDLFEADWRMYPSVDYTTLVSNNGFSPLWSQAIIWAKAGF